MSRGKGAVRSPAHKIARFGAIHALVGAALAWPADTSLYAHAAPARFDQNGYNCCTGCGGSGCAFAACSARGFPMAGPPSQHLLYSDARCVELPQNPDGSLPPLQDTGASIADVVTAIANRGVGAPMGPTPEGRYCDINAANLNVRATLAEDEETRTELLVGAYAIDASSSNAPVQIGMALAANAPVLIGMFVDSGFERFGDTRPNGTAFTGVINQQDPQGGGHCMFIVAFRTEADGTRSFLLVNSWGESWGDATFPGCMWISEASLMPALWEAYALSVSKAAA